MCIFLYTVFVRIVRKRGRSTQKVVRQSDVPVKTYGDIQLIGWCKDGQAMVYKLASLEAKSLRATLEYIGAIP